MSKFWLVVILSVITMFVLGIYYFSHNDESFNNIATPFVALLSLVVYSIALFHSFRQNRIILSQGIKPDFDKQIDKLVKTAKKIRFVNKNENLYLDEEINALNFLDYIEKSLLTLVHNKEYMELYNKESYIENKKMYDAINSNSNYRHHLMFLYDFIIHNEEIYQLYSKIKPLIIHINNSKMIEEDKLLLKNRIKYELNIDKYIQINQEKSFPKIYMGEDIGRTQALKETYFGEFLDFFKKELNYSTSNS